MCRGYIKDKREREKCVFVYVFVCLVWLFAIGFVVENDDDDVVIAVAVAVVVDDDVIVIVLIVIVVVAIDLGSLCVLLLTSWRTLRCGGNQPLFPAVIVSGVVVCTVRNGSGCIWEVLRVTV